MKTNIYEIIQIIDKLKGKIPEDDMKKLVFLYDQILTGDKLITTDKKYPYIYIDWDAEKSQFINYWEK